MARKITVFIIILILVGLGISNWLYYLSGNMGRIPIVIETGLFIVLSLGILILEKTNRELKKRIEMKTGVLEDAKNILEVKVQARTRELKELADSLEVQVSERTKQLEEKVKELERFNKLTIGRELRMIELKKEIERCNKSSVGGGVENSRIKKTKDKK